jgi:hypothetical protein
VRQQLLLILMLVIVISYFEHEHDYDQEHDQYYFALEATIASGRLFSASRNSLWVSCLPGNF